MRISDWSSDVCSSDLPLVVVPAEVEAAHAVICRAQPVQRIDRIGIEPQGLAKAVQRKRGIACGKLSLAPRIVIARISRGSVGGLAAPPDIGGHLRAAAPCDRDRRQENCRSEEHTSELQSLMRIAYAGF